MKINYLVLLVAIIFLLAVQNVNGDPIYVRACGENLYFLISKTCEELFFSCKYLQDIYTFINYCNTVIIFRLMICFIFQPQVPNSHQETFRTLQAQTL